MKYNHRSFTPVLFICFFLLVAGCKKESRTSWETEMLVPIAHTNLTLKNLIKDSLLKVNSDNVLSIVQQSHLYDFSLADKVIDFPDTAIKQKFNVSNLVLGNQSINQSVTLGRSLPRWQLVVVSNRFLETLSFKTMVK
ncbi:MAG: hypothetical protein IPP77_14885 [Bacteroidetes bacterium]|nr:hypothetical protein [Bacteroidota bacterium]